MTHGFLYYSASSFVDHFTLNWRQTPTWSPSLLCMPQKFLSMIFFLIKDEGKLRIRFLKNVPVTISILYKLQKEIKWGKESIHNIKVNNTLGKLFLSKIVYWFTFKISNKLKYRYTVISKLFVMFYREKK